MSTWHDFSCQFQKPLLTAICYWTSLLIFLWNVRHSQRLRYKLNHASYSHLHNEFDPVECPNGSVSLKECQIVKLYVIINLLGTHTVLIVRISIEFLCSMKNLDFLSMYRFVSLLVMWIDNGFSSSLYEILPTLRKTVLNFKSQWLRFAKTKNTQYKTNWESCHFFTFKNLFLSSSHPYKIIHNHQKKSLHFK